MVPEILQEAQPIVVGMAAGYGVGAYLQGRVARHTQANQDRLVEDWAVLSSEPKGKIRRGLGIVTMSAVLGIGLNGLAYETDASAQPTPANVEIVADQSGGTILNGGLAAEEISTIVKNFEDKDINASAYRAKGDEVTHVKLSNFNENKGPFGNAPLFDATKSALDQAVLNQSKSSIANHNGVLILTNGNSIDQAEGLVTEAQTNNVPLFVVNVESKGTNPLVTENLKQIATKTEGKYWEANDKNIDKVSNVVKETLAPGSNTESDAPSPWPKRVMGAILAFAGIASAYEYDKKRTRLNVSQR